MNALVLGSNGFIGSELISVLVRSNDDLRYNKIVGIDIQHDKFENRYIPKELYLYNKDISKVSLSEIVDDKFDVIINSAASVGVDYVYNNPLSTTENNLSITRNLCNYISRIKENNKDYNPLVIFFSSSEVYGNSEISDPSLNVYNLFPNTSRGIYSITKLLEENYYNLLHINNEIINVLILRLFNIVGPTQNNDFVIGRLFSKILNIENISVSANSYRKFCYIDFLTESLLQMIQYYSTGHEISGTINFGSLRTDNYISIKDLASKIAKLCYGNLSKSLKNIKLSISEKEAIIKRNFEPSINTNCSISVLEAIENSKEYDLPIDKILEVYHEKFYSVRSCSSR